jgi:hypothetical protein
MIRRGSSKICCVVPGCSWWWFSEPSLGGFLGVFLGPCSWGFDGGNSCEPFVVLLPLIPLPNLWVKGLDFGVFRCSRVRGVIGGISLIPLDLASFGGLKLGYGLLMRCSYYPQSLAQVRGPIREIKVWIWGSWPAGAVHPKLPRLTDLTSVRDRSDWCRPFVGFASGELLDLCVFGSWCCWSVLDLFGVVLLGFV